MTTTQQSATRNFTYPDLAHDNQAWPTDAIAIATKRPILDESLRITRALQTTLDTEELLEIFYKEIKKLISYTGLSYNNIPQGITHIIGKVSPHACTYHLVIAGEPLGELSFTRRRKFTDQETMIIEYLMCSLVYPLRNALMYKYALQMALKDPLTGVNNRVAMDSTLQREVELAHRYGTPLSLLALDVDHFKVVNDTYGHQMGDQVLREIAAVIRTQLRGGDVLARYGGEEFSVLLAQTGAEGALEIAERVRHSIDEHRFALPRDQQGSAQFSVTISIGIATFNPEHDPHAVKMNGDVLLGHADRALYDAKARGRNRVVGVGDIVQMAQEVW